MGFSPAAMAVGSAIEAVLIVAALCLEAIAILAESRRSLDWRTEGLRRRASGATTARRRFLSFPEPGCVLLQPCRHALTGPIVPADIAPCDRRNRMSRSNSLAL